MSNFELYINTLKFCIVAATSTIENYLHLESQSRPEPIKDLLKGKIFK